MQKVEKMHQLILKIKLTHLPTEIAMNNTTSILNHTDPFKCSRVTTRVVDNVQIFC